MKFVIFFFSIFLFAVSNSFADLTASRPDGHAPIGVMGEHTHNAGEWMLSYRYMNMFMAGNRSGTDNVSNNDVLKNFMVAPTRMKMEMHMAGAMWAPLDRLTLMAMAPFIRKSMDHVNRMGRTFNTESRGLGDVKVTGLVVVCQSRHHQIHLNVGVSLPTGSIDETDETLTSGVQVQLPYPMQLGSGTFDLLPGVTYFGQTAFWSWGSQLIFTKRLGENDRDYTLGDQVKANLWGARKLLAWLSASLRLEGVSWGDIDGRDTALTATMVPTADPKRRAGDRVDVLVGINLYKPEGALKGHRVAVEVGVPVYQRLDGPQLETDYLTTVGWQKSF